MARKIRGFLTARSRSYAKFVYIRSHSAFRLNKGGLNRKRVGSARLRFTSNPRSRATPAFTSTRSLPMVERLSSIANADLNELAEWNRCRFTLAGIIDARRPELPRSPSAPVPCDSMIEQEPSTAQKSPIEVIKCGASLGGGGKWRERREASLLDDSRRRIGCGELSEHDAVGGGELLVDGIAIASIHFANLAGEMTARTISPSFAFDLSPPSSFKSGPMLWRT